MTFQGRPVTVQHSYPAYRDRKGKQHGPFFDVFSTGRKPLLIKRSALATELKGTETNG